jgi:zinc/manganese transport system ATP-binding protein
MTAAHPAVELDRASMRLGGRTLWENLSLTMPRGEFLAVLGPNGSGKTSLLRALLGLLPLSGVKTRLEGHPPTRGGTAIGYVPQQRAIDPDLPIRGRDLVAFGLDGHRLGFSLRRRASGEQVEDMLRVVGAAEYADLPIGRLSGGEQQRLRIAQALVGSPRLLLCDEPLLSLDLNSQQAIVQLLWAWSRRRGATVIFVTHDINPLLGVAGRVLLLASGGWAVGSAEEVLTDETLSKLYGLPVQVLRVQGRVVVLGAELGGHEPVSAPPVRAR